jgi:hypothetical protein
MSPLSNDATALRTFGTSMHICPIVGLGHILANSGMKKFQQGQH